jgi:hypothetical protein
MMPVQEGRHTSTFVPAQPFSINLHKTIVEWPLQVAGHLGQKHRSLRSTPSSTEMRSRMDSDPQVGRATVQLPRLEAEPTVEPPPAAARVEAIPPFRGRWAASAMAEPAARMVYASTAVAPRISLAPRLGNVIEMPLGRRRFEEMAACTAPGPEAVTVFVRSSTALTPISVMAARREIAPVQIADWMRTLPVAGFVGSPSAEAVVDFVRPSTALTPVEMTAAALRMPRALASLCDVDRRQETIACPTWVAAPEAQPAERFLQVASDLAPLVNAVHEVRLQLPRIAAAIEPLPVPVPDEPLVIPAICLQAMPSPTAEPVCLFVRSSEAAFVTMELPLALPVLGLEPALPYIPWVVAMQRVGAAEPVMSGVQPRTASLPVAPISTAVLLALPEIPTPSEELFGMGAALQGPAAEPVESMAIAAEKAVPAAMAAAFRVPDAAVFALAERNGAPAMAGPMVSLAAQPAESLLVASSADALGVQPRMRVLEFTIEASGDLVVPGFDAPGIAPKASEPAAALPHRMAPQPMTTISVKAPKPEHKRILPTLPQPGMLPVEFHAQRLRGVVYENPEWKTSRLAPVPPKFAVRPVFGKLEEPAPQPKPVKQEPEFVKTFSNPAKRPSALWLMAGKIAAGVLLASSLWYAYSFRAHVGGGVEVAGSTSAAMPSSGRNEVTSVTRGAAQSGTSGGPVAWVRQTLAKRASVEVTDHFRDGMTGWGSKGTSSAPGWSHHPDGYIVPSSLAFFRPSMNFKDYRFEFFGQIENKGMSWSVRAKDPNNYHAMKVAVVEAGLRPFVALVHWDVIDGKAGKQSRTPLNIMVHNNRPMQVAVEVDGTRLVTSIDGEEVETMTYTTLASGGVGFFADANERARLYWMRVSKNDDWLGHACGFLAGQDATRATAELRGPQFPGDSPMPGMPGRFPGEDNTMMAAVWAGLPYLRAAQKARASNTRRTQRWNT